MFKQVLPAFGVGLILGIAAERYYEWPPRSYLHDGVQWQFTEAAGRGDLYELKRLHAAGAAIDGWPQSKHTESGFPAITLAAMSGQAEAIQWLIEQGADFNVLTATETPLDSAEYHLRQAQRAVEILKARGPNTEASNDG